MKSSAGNKKRELENTHIRLLELLVPAFRASGLGVEELDKTIAQIEDLITSHVQPQAAGNKELREQLWKLFTEMPNENDGRGTVNHYIDVLIPFITASNQQLLRELEEQAEVYPEKGIGSITPVRAVPLSIIQDKLKEIE